MKIGFIPFVALLFAAVPALAFFPPEDSRDGVTARFIGFDEASDKSGLVAARRDIGEPFEIRLDIANATDSPVSGDLAFWLNDDWNLALKGEAQDKDAARSGEDAAHPDAHAHHPDAQALPCAISPHSTNSFFATAIPKPGRVLPALYPIHASFSLPGGDPLHPIAVFLATTNGRDSKDKSAHGPRNPTRTEQTDLLTPNGVRENVSRVSGEPIRLFENEDSIQFQGGLPLRLARLPGTVFTQMPGADPRPVSESAETGAFFDPGWQVADGDVRFGFYSQPPWRTGAGSIWRDIPVSLPASTPLVLRFSTALAAAIKDGEGASDGAEYKIFVVEEDGRSTELHSSLVTSHAWIDATADLSPWAGKSVTIRLWNGCGPAGSPHYDRCLWGDVGIVGEDMKQTDLFAANAAHEAKAVRPEQIRVFSLPLSVRSEAWTATFTPGPSGLLDGTLAFTDGARTLSFTGFTCAIDDILVGAGPLDARCTGCEVLRDDGNVVVSHQIDLRDGRTVVARATLRADGPALRIRWDMPGTVRDDRGSPRFTRLGIGPGSLPAARAYLSFGNVLESPRSFSLSAGNFRNLARHAGADYANGASLCQAVDVYPDRVVCRRESNVFAVETCHDATFSFVPSARGAFAAARAFRDVAGYARSPAWREAATRMCLDQWGGGYAKTIAGLEKAAKYVVTHGSFVLYGGGLGWRYASNSHARGGDPAKGSGSDGYLCTTVVGGRTPMCDMEPFDPRAVTTWWLLGDVSRALALADFESFDFAGSIHRQHSVFSDGSQVWVNRPGGAGGSPAKNGGAGGSPAKNGGAGGSPAKNGGAGGSPAKNGGAGGSPAENGDAGGSPAENWLLPNGLSLPADGFYAETPDARAGIVEIAGRRCAFSQSCASTFVDGRPDRNDGTGPADTANAAALADFSQVLCSDAQALPCAIKTDGAFRLERDGATGDLLLTPIPGTVPFRAEINLAAIVRVAAVAPFPAVTAVEPIEPSLDAAWPDWSQKDGVLSLSVDAKSFTYRIGF